MGFTNYQRFPELICRGDNLVVFIGDGNLCAGIVPFDRNVRVDGRCFTINGVLNGDFFSVRRCGGIQLNWPVDSCIVVKIEVWFDNVPPVYLRVIPNRKGGVIENVA